LRLLLYLFHCSLTCVYFYDDVSGYFYPFVNKIELSWAWLYQKCQNYC